MIILGVDPGLANTGWGLIEKKASKNKVLAYGQINTSSKDSIQERLIKIYHKYNGLLDEYHPDVVAMEQLFISTGDRSAMSVLGVGQAVGVVNLASALRDIPVQSFDARRIKEALVGYGAATKEQVQYMVQRLLLLKEKPKPDHAADALAVAICYSHTSGVLNNQ